MRVAHRFQKTEDMRANHERTGLAQLEYNTSLEARKRWHGTGTVGDRRPKQRAAVTRVRLARARTITRCLAAHHVASEMT